MRTRLLAAVLVLSCGPKDPADTTAASDDGAADTTAASDDGSADTGLTTGAPADACAEFCERLHVCGFDGDFHSCPCNAELGGEKCLAQWQEATQCFAEATCEALQGSSPCWDVYLAAGDRCEFGEDGCSDEYTLLGAPNTCGFGVRCLDEPSREIDCESATCTCTVDEVEVATCPSMLVCDVEAESFEARFTACCGG